MPLNPEEIRALETELDAILEIENERMRITDLLYQACRTAKPVTQEEKPHVS